MNAANNISEWVRLADMDMATARHMFETYSPKPIEIICFHSQQAAEKMLKCYLIFRNIETPKTYDMQTLCEMCVELDTNFNTIYRSAVLLTRYGVIPRYPTELVLIEQDAINAIGYANDVMVFVKNMIPENSETTK